jgi:hypothetical protein
MVVEDEDEAIDLDPFTDPKKGRCALITYNQAKKKTSLKISDKITPLTLEEMEAYDKLTPISRMQNQNYSMTDFELALEGIQYFDETEEVNLFESEEFQNIIKTVKKELKAKFTTKPIAKDVAEETGEDMKTAEDEDEDGVDDLPFDTDEDEEVITSKKKDKKTGGKAVKKKPPVEEDDEDNLEENLDEEMAEEAEELVESEVPEDDEFTYMERKDLVSYKIKKKWDDVKLLKNDTDDEMRDKLRAKLAESVEEDLSNREGEQSADDDDEEGEVAVVTSKKKTVAKDEVATGKPKLTVNDIKARMQANKKNGLAGKK